VDTPGIYIVHQYLVAGCAEYATDTIEIFAFQNCEILSSNLSGFRATLGSGEIHLDWDVLYNHVVDYFYVERSFDGIHFSPVARVESDDGVHDFASYRYTDPVQGNWKPAVFYRILMKEHGKLTRYSHVIKIPLRSNDQSHVMFLPNPANDALQLRVQALRAGEVKVNIFNAVGKLVFSHRYTVQKGMNMINLAEIQNAPRGVYTALVTVDEEIFSETLILVR
jgi:hypothetical protein